MARAPAGARLPVCLPRRHLAQTELGRRDQKRQRARGHGDQCQGHREIIGATEGMKEDKASWLAGVPEGSQKTRAQRRPPRGLGLLHRPLHAQRVLESPQLEDRRGSGNAQNSPRKPRRLRPARASGEEATHFRRLRKPQRTGRTPYEKVCPISPNEESLLRSASAILMGQSEERETGKVYLNPKYF